MDNSLEGVGKGQEPRKMLEVQVGMVTSWEGVGNGQGPKRMLWIWVEKDEWNGNIMGYKGEGEWGLRELLGGEKVLKTYRFRSRTRDLSDEGG